MTILAGFVSLALITLVVSVFQEDIAQHYYLLRLRSQPEYLASCLSKAEVAAKQTALCWYLRTREGKQALFRMCLTSKPVKYLTTHKVKEIDAFVWPDAPDHDSIQFIDRSWIYQDLLRPLPWTPPQVEWLQLVRENFVDGDSFTFPEYPGIIFTYVQWKVSE